MKKWLVTPTEKDQIMETLTYSLDEKTIIITNSWGGGWFIFESEKKPELHVDDVLFVDIFDTPYTLYDHFLDASQGFTQSLLYIGVTSKEQKKWEKIIKNDGPFVLEVEGWSLTSEIKIFGYIEIKEKK